MTTTDPRKLVLASASVGRRNLLRGLGLQFEVDPSNIDETMPEQMSIQAVVRSLARAKAREVAPRHEDALIVAADTLVALYSARLGKPADAADARRMLAYLSGRTHRVVSGVVVRDTQTAREEMAIVETAVTFRSLTSAEIAAYVETGEPLDKAGAYAAQGLSSTFITRIEGDFFNVVGLPLATLDGLMRKFGTGLLARGLAAAAADG